MGGGSKLALLLIHRCCCCSRAPGRGLPGTCRLLLLLLLPHQWSHQPDVRPHPRFQLSKSDAFKFMIEKKPASFLFRLSCFIRFTDVPPYTPAVPLPHFLFATPQFNIKKLKTQRRGRVYMLKFCLSGIAATFLIFKSSQNHIRPTY